MQLSEMQRDALTELINIAFSKTAASLSDLTGDRVELDVPEVSVHPIGDLLPALRQFVQGEVATVHQIFDGEMGGDALLLLNFEGAAKLIELLTGDVTGPSLGTSSKEVLSEIGNILLNACLGVFGDILKVRMSFTVPRLHLEALETLLRSLTIGKDELQFGLIVGARFHLKSSAVGGCLVIVLGVASLDQLIAAVENWARLSVSPNPSSDL
jgi:chemotaxis protein CheC